MKKILKLIILFVMCLIVFIGLTGCGENYEDDAKEGVFPNDYILTEEGKKEYNERFTLYPSSIDGGNAKSLIDTVKASNSNYSVKNVTLKGTTEINDVDSSKTYEVQIEYDTDGYVSVITIKEK